MRRAKQVTFSVKYPQICTWRHAHTFYNIDIETSPFILLYYCCKRSVEEDSVMNRRPPFRFRLCLQWKLQMLFLSVYASIPVAVPHVTDVNKTERQNAVFMTTQLTWNESQGTLPHFLGFCLYFLHATPVPKFVLRICSIFIILYTKKKLCREVETIKRSSSICSS